MRLSTLILLTILPCILFAQVPRLREVPEEYQMIFKENKKEKLKQIRQLKKEGWDIVLDPIEVIPINEYNLVGVQAATNWGEQLLVSEVRQRIREECTFPVIVKIGDTGGSYDHPDLQTGQLVGKNYTTDENLSDLHGHSTHVVGIIGARELGLAWELVDMGLLYFKPLKVLTNSGSGSFQSIADAIVDQRADDVALLAEGAAVIYNFSLGGGTGIVQSVEAELKHSWEKGVMFVAAAGNTGGKVQYPGLSQYTLGISSLDPSLEISSYSCRGQEIDQSMPGRGINSTYKNGSYATLSGTSMASPFQAAAAAIAHSKWGSEKIPSPGAMRQYLGEVAADLGSPGKDHFYGWGLDYIIAILDTEPGEYVPEDPPEDPEGPRIRPGRDLSFTFSGYEMLWKEIAPTNRKRSFFSKLFGVKENRMGASFTFEEIPRHFYDEYVFLPLIEIRWNDCPYDADVAYNMLEESLDKFFTNRGVWIPAPADFADAGKWSMYFVEMIFWRQYEWDLSTERVYIEDSSGTTYLDEEDWQHYRKRKNE